MWAAQYTLFVWKVHCDTEVSEPVPVSTTHCHLYDENISPVSGPQLWENEDIDSGAAVEADQLGKSGFVGSIVVDAKF